MLLKVAVPAGVLAAAIAFALHFAPQFAPLAASASPISSHAGALGAAAAEVGLVGQVQWRYCRVVREDCAAAWGWRTWRYFRCAARRGCG
jgi:hypothetical protein